MNWWQISIVLSSYGFFKEYRPSEPFISPYLTQFKNFTIEQINQDIYPLGTYFYMSLLIVVFLLTDWLRYKPILLAGSVSAVVTWCLLVYGTTLTEMQVVEFFYGFFMASEVAYFSYIYAKVDKVHYQKVTSHARAAFLLGKSSAGISSQLLVNLDVLNYLQLNYLTIGGVSLATLAVFLLPSVDRSIYFHRKGVKGDVDDDTVADLQQSASSLPSGKCRSSFTRLYDDLRQAFTCRWVLQWSFWWAFATCGFLQVISYCQLLWEEIMKQDESTLYHGYVEFVTSLLGATVSFVIGYLNVSWVLWGEISLGILTVAQGVLLWYSSYLSKLYVAYIMFVIYHVFYQAAITVATCEIAKYIKERSYALVFGINTFLALILQALLTGVVIDALGLSIRTQFKVYGGYHMVIGTGFVVSGVLTLAFFRHKLPRNQS